MKQIIETRNKAIGEQTKVFERLAAHVGYGNVGDGGGGGNENGGKGRTPNPNPECKHCGREHPNPEKCWALKENLDSAPAWFKTWW